MSDDLKPENEITPFLPAFFPEDGQDPVPPELIGSQIIAFGALSIEDGVPCLAIDFIPSGETEVKRMIFGMTSLGMWVEK